MAQSGHTGSECTYYIRLFTSNVKKSVEVSYVLIYIVFQTFFTENCTPHNKQTGDQIKLIDPLMACFILCFQLPPGRQR